MSELHDAAALVLEVQTGDALARVTALDAALKGLGVTGLANAGKDAAQFSEHVAKLESSLGAAHTELNKLKVANGDLARANEKLGATNGNLARSVETLEGQLETLKGKLDGGGGLSKAVQGVDKSLRNVALTSREAGRALDQGLGSVTKQFEAISVASRATSTQVKNAVAALTVDVTGGTGLRAYYEQLQRTSSLVAQVASSETRSHAAMVQARQQAVAALTRENVEVQKLGAHYAALEAVGRTSAASSVLFRSEAISVASRATSTQVKNAVAALTVDVTGGTGLRAYYEQLQRTSSLVARVAESESKAQAAMTSARQQAIAALTRENTEVQKLGAHYAALEAASRRSAALAAVKPFETASQAARAKPSQVKNAVAALTVDFSGQSGLRDYYAGLEKASQIPAPAGIEATGKELGKVKEAAGHASKAMGQFAASQWEAHAAARGLAGSLGQLWMTYGSLAPLLAGAAIGASFREVIRVGKDVEKQLTFVAALGGESVASMTQFSAAVKGSMFSLTEAAEGMRAMAQSGLSTREALEQLPGVLRLATVGEMTVAEAAYAATGVMHAFGLEVEDMGRVGDVFAKAAAVSNTSVKGMMEAMRQASTVADLYGVSLEETAASLAVMAKRNIEGSAAGTALRNALNEMATPIKAAKQAMEAIDFSAFDEGTKKVKPLPQMLQELQVQLSDLDQKSRLQFLDRMFGERGAKAVNAILSDMQEFNRTLGQMKDASSGLGFVAEVVQQLEGTLSGKLKGLLADFQTSLATVYEQNSAGLKGLVDQIRTLVSSQGFIDFLDIATKALMTLTQAVLNNIDTIKIAVAAYAGFKIASAVALDLGNLAKSFGNLAGSATTSATGLANFFGKAGLVGGWLGTAVGLITPVYIAWQEYTHRISEAEKANAQFAANAGKVAETLQTEYSRLVESVNQLTLRNQLLREGKSIEEAAAQSKIQTAGKASQDQLDLLNQEITALKKMQALRAVGMPSSYAELNVADGQRVLNKYQDRGVNAPDLIASLEQDARKLEIAIRDTQTSTACVVAIKGIEDAAKQAGKTLEEATTWNSRLSDILKKRKDLSKDLADSLRVDINSDPATLADRLQKAQAAAREKGVIVSKDLPSTSTAPKIDRSALQDVTSIGKRAELEYQAELKRIDLRDQTAQVLQKNELITEKQYQDLQDQISESRIAAARQRIAREQEEITAERNKPGVNKATLEALDRKQGELDDRSKALDVEIDVKGSKAALDTYSNLQGAAFKYTKMLGQIREENKLNLEEQQKQFDLSKIADPVQLAGLQAEW